ncbi:hypothetical protein [Streptomyces sp. NPDC005953]
MQRMPFDAGTAVPTAEHGTRTGAHTPGAATEDRPLPLACPRRTVR